MFSFIFTLVIGLVIGYELGRIIEEKRRTHTLVFDYPTYGIGYDDGFDDGYKKGYAECLEDEKHRKSQEVTQ